MADSPWHWSAEHGDYYRHVLGSDNNWKVIWGRSTVHDPDKTPQSRPPPAAPAAPAPQPYGHNTQTYPQNYSQTSPTYAQPASTHGYTPPAYRQHPQPAPSHNPYARQHPQHSSRPSTQTHSPHFVSSTYVQPATYPADEDDRSTDPPPTTRPSDSTDPTISPFSSRSASTGYGHTPQSSGEYSYSNTSKWPPGGQ